MKYRAFSTLTSAYACALLLAGCSGDDTNNGAGKASAADSKNNAGGAGHVEEATGSGGQAGSMESSGAGGQSTGSAGQGGDGDQGGGGQAGRTTDGGGQAGGAAGADSGAVKSSCMGNPWPTADPQAEGQFPIVTETKVGPMAGQPDPKYNNTIPQFNIYRPMDLAQGGYCHPIVGWSNGHGDQPSTYEVLLKQLASHGFVVIASLSSIPSQGDPLPVVAGINWIVQQNDDPQSEFYHHLDTAHIGAIGHSEGGAATSGASSDPHVTTIASVSGASPNPGIHGPALLFCGGKDTVVPCSKIKDTFDSIKDYPVMLAENLASDHGAWLYQNGIKGPDIFGITGWMRVQLMNDTANRKMFYGPNCALCTDNRLQVTRSMMDQ